MGGSSKKQTVGYRYYMGLHFGVCHGPVDKVREIRVGDRSAWTGSVTANGSFVINQPQLFGGEKKEGGIHGTVWVEMGGAAQTPNSYLTTSLGTIPAFRGFLGLVYNGLIACNNPYVKPWAVRVERVLEGWNSTGGTWYSAKAAIGDGHMNPAHIIVQCLTDPLWGMGYSPATIGDSFTAAADTLHSEDFGLSLLWNQQTSIEEFIQHVVDHIGAAFYVDLSTGKFELDLIRADYNVATIPALDESNVLELVSFQRGAWVDTVNEVVVMYRDVANGGEQATLSVQDLANVTAQGGVVSQQRDYPGLPTAALAARVAERDLLAASSPLSKVQLRVNRTQWDLKPGAVFKLSWSKYGLVEVVYRVGQVSLGTLTDPTITVDAVEDVFALPLQSYASAQPTQWVAPPSEPEAAENRLLQEVPYYDLATKIPAADLAARTPLTGHVAAYGIRPNFNSENYEIWTRVGSDEFEERATGEFVPTATLAGSIGQMDTTITLANLVDMDLLNQAGRYAVIGTECVRVDDLSDDMTEATIVRGVLDTHPVAHSIGDRIYFVENFGGYDPTEWAQGEEVDVRMVVQGSGGSLSGTDTPPAFGWDFSNGPPVTHEEV